MALDPSYVLAPSLQMYFVDKDSGLPLVAGKVYFYEAGSGFTIPKPVYEISGVAPDYQYTELPNPVILSSVGTFQDDSGNDIVPYYNVIDSDGEISLYDISVYSSGDVLQFTRIGWPNFSNDSIVADQDITNFVANGQFLLHNNPLTNSMGVVVPLSGPQVKSVFAYGGTTGTLEVYQIAQGGWTFERNNSSTAVDSVTFTSFPAVTTPSGNPRFAVQIATTSSGSDTAKDLCLKFPGVNTFASDSQNFNLYCEGESVSGGSITVQVLIRKFFGTGGDATTETDVTTITLSATINKFNVPILFGTNTNKTISSTGDDFVEIVLRLPPTGTQSALFTDFALTINDEILTSFPAQVPSQQIESATAGYLPVPNPSGTDLYLPIRLSPSGFSFDYSSIGQIVAYPYATPGIGELVCDGTTYLTSGYSLDGIPYSRLQAKLFNGVRPIYGTGPTYATATQSTGTTQRFLLSNNGLSTSTAPANGTSSPAFTFTSVNAGSALGYGIKAYQFAASSLYVRGNTGGSVTSATAGTTSFTVTEIRNLSSVSTPHIFSIQTVSGASITGGQYFTFTSLNPGTVNYAMWFKIDGAGAAPVIGGSPTLIEVDLLSTMSAQDVAIAIIAALNGSQQYEITTVAASAITSGNWFSFGTPNGSSYYVWYKKDSTGTNPAPGSYTLGIEVDILTADTNAIVAQKTVAAINGASFAVPNFQGMFLRGVDSSATWDIEAAIRFGMTSNVYGNAIGTFEFDQFLSHNHTGFTTYDNYSAAPVGSNVFAAGATHLDATIAYTGGTQVTPVNAYVYWMIKY